MEHCEEHGYERIFLTDACLVGAQELYALGRLKPISNNVQVDTSTSNILPRSCYRQYDSHLWINTAWGAEGSCSHDRTCICRNVISKPICNAESQVNTGICECGTTVCNAGFYCKSEENLVLCQIAFQKQKQIQKHAVAELIFAFQVSTAIVKTTSVPM